MKTSRHHGPLVAVLGGAVLVGACGQTSSERVTETTESPGSTAPPTSPVTTSPLPAAHRYAAAGVHFESTRVLERSEPGLNAVRFSEQPPPDGQAGRPALYVVLVTPIPEMVEALGADGTRGSLKVEFMATAAPGERTERTFMGNLTAGERQRSTVPGPAQIETYLLPLPDGAHVFVGLSFDPERVSAEEGERFFADVASSVQSGE